jgi:hypothetical protein
MTTKSLVALHFIVPQGLSVNADQTIRKNDHVLIKIAIHFSDLVSLPSLL